MQISCYVNGSRTHQRRSNVVRHHGRPSAGTRSDRRRTWLQRVSITVVAGGVHGVRVCTRLVESKRFFFLGFFVISPLFQAVRSAFCRERYAAVRRAVYTNLDGLRRRRHLCVRACNRYVDVVDHARVATVYYGRKPIDNKLTNVHCLLSPSVRRNTIPIELVVRACTHYVYVIMIIVIQSVSRRSNIIVI